MELYWLQKIVCVVLIGLCYVLLTCIDRREDIEEDEAFSFDIDESLKNPFDMDSDF